MVLQTIDIISPGNYRENVDIEEALNKTGHGRYNLFVLVSCCTLNIGATIDMLCFNVIVPAATCDLNLTLTESGLLMSISLAGFLTALPWGYVADTRGRRLAMLTSGTVGFIVSAISSFSTSFYMMMVLKFIATSFSTASMTLTVVFLGENTCTKYRTKYLFILNVANFASDFICFAIALLILPLDFAVSIPFLVNYKPWRLLTLVLSIPIAVGTILMFFLQESPKFLASRGDSDKALANLKLMYMTNNGMQNVYPVKSLSKKDVFSDNKSFWDSVLKQVVPIFQQPLLTRTLQLLSLFTICVSTSNVFYTWFPAMLNSFFTSVDGDTDFCQKIVVNITPTKYEDTCIENGSINTLYSGMVFALVLTIFNIVVVAFANWRRLLIIGACLISGICLIIVNMVHPNITSLILFFMIQIVGVTFGSIQSYFVDIYPTSCRGLATSLGTMVARLACLGAVSLMGAVVVDNCQLTFYCWAVYVFCGILLTMFLPGNVQIKETSVENTKL